MGSAIRSAHSTCRTLIFKATRTGAGPTVAASLMLRVLPVKCAHAGLEDVPAFIEIIYPFELADEQVCENIASTVMHCRREYAGEAMYSVQEA